MSRIVLGVSASVALYKACDLASRLTQAGHEVRAVLTRGAAELVSPQLFEALTARPALATEFGSGRRTAMDHIDIGKWGELLAVAPASADLIGKLAHGIADDLLTTVALVLPQTCPRLICPAMNPSMLAALPVQRNLAQLRADGWQVIEPEVGTLACGDEGQGRLAEPQTIAAAIAALLAR